VNFALGALCLLLAAGARAETWHSAAISQVYPLGNGDFVLILAQGATACIHPNKYHYVQVGSFGVTADGARAMLATSLTAFAMGKSVSVLFDETSYGCQINRMLVAN
jgi:hypothetical protein